MRAATLNQQIRQELLALRSRDEDTRAELAATGELFEGYHPTMAAVHADNAESLRRIIETWGWPGKPLVGEDGTQAAWAILQHAIAHPTLQRQCLPLVREAAEKGDVPAYQVAYLEDRIACFENRPQRYGTQFDWDDDGRMSPLPLQDEARVDEYRASVGLDPLAHRIRQIRSESAGVKPPDDLKAWRDSRKAWAESVGWLMPDSEDD